MNFDNQVISITGMGDVSLVKALEFFPLKDTIGYRVTDKHGLILYWAEVPDLLRFPYTISDKEVLMDFIRGWLKSSEAGKIRGQQPDHDGDNEAAWMVYNEAWTHVGGQWQAICAIRPIWAMYGK